MHRPAQTLLELVIAVGVITVSVVATLTLIIRTVDIGQQSQTLSEATNYAREGIEVARMVRDSNWLLADDNIQVNGLIAAWNGDGTASGLPLSGSYIPAFSPTTGWGLQSCTGTCTATAQQLYAVTTAGRTYATQALTGVAGGTRIRYSRQLVITGPVTETTPIGGTTATLEYLDVTARVTWQAATGQKQVVLQERLYNWR